MHEGHTVSTRCAAAMFSWPVLSATSTSLCACCSRRRRQSRQDLPLASFANTRGHKLGMDIPWGCDDAERVILALARCPAAEIVGRSQYGTEVVLWHERHASRRCIATPSVAIHLMGARGSLCFSG
jgi:hypothetical protein